MTYIDKLKPGIIRKCIGATDNQKWVVIDSTHWRHMDGEGASECVTMSDDPSTVVGLLPDLELDSTDWCERYKLPDPCIHNAKEYEPLWDGAYADGVGRWISRYLDNGNLYDSDGCQVVVKKDPPVTQSVNPTQQPSKPDIDKLKPQFELLPGIIRQCTTVDKKWVVIDSMHWRWMDHKYVSESTSPSTLSDNPSNVVGLLPRGELDSTVWREAYVLPTPCICNAGEYQPHWDEASAAWFSRHLDSGHLYDMDGTRQPPQPSKPAQPPQPALAAVVRFFKKYW